MIRQSGWARWADGAFGVCGFCGGGVWILKLEIHQAIGMDRVEDGSVFVADIVGELAGVSISLEGFDHRASQGLKGFSHRLCRWLGVDLAIAFDDLSMESAKDIRVIHRGMVMVAERG